MTKFILISAIITSSLVFAACGDTSVNNNRTNINVIRATPVPTPTVDTTNANVSREEYDKNHAQYEKDKGSSTIGQGANDSWIWFKTKTALAAADDLRDSTINVDVANDMITLKGTVASAAQKSQAETVAKGIEGQKGVKNELTVNSKDSMTNQMVNGSTSNSNKK